MKVAPEDVHRTLRQHMLLTGYPIVLDLERSHGSYARDALTGRDYLDLSSFYASNPLGFNHAGMRASGVVARLARAATVKVANPDFYTTLLAEFVATLARTAAPPELPHYFFVEGGSLAVENGMKAAFDWKARHNLQRGRAARGTQILHFERAFHGRSGYALSVTNTDPTKTLHFPMFDWPRIPAPSISFPMNAASLERVIAAERASIAACERAFDERPHEIAAILIEPVQGEGGDNHFRPEFLRELRRLANEREALLIFDEVQTGVGMTGAWWAFQKLGVRPDIVCFAKKMQVGGLLVSRRIDDVDSVFSVPSRICSTWGGNLVDMVRATRILEIIEDDRLLDNVAARSAQLLTALHALADNVPDLIGNVRGLGLMCAVDLPSTALRDRALARCFDEGVLVLGCGTRTMRFRPALTIDAETIDEAMQRIGKALCLACAA